MADNLPNPFVSHKDQRGEASKFRLFQDSDGNIQFCNAFGSDFQPRSIARCERFLFLRMFILTFRSDIAYERWWEGGTLLQKTRGEWCGSWLWSQVTSGDHVGLQ